MCGNLLTLSNTRALISNYDIKCRTLAALTDALPVTRFCSVHWLINCPPEDGRKLGTIFYVEFTRNSVKRYWKSSLYGWMIWSAAYLISYRVWVNWIWNVVWKSLCWLLVLQSYWTLVILRNRVLGLAIPSLQTHKSEMLPPVPLKFHIQCTANTHHIREVSNSNPELNRVPRGLSGRVGSGISIVTADILC